MHTQREDTQPWYKQFWAWFVLAPLILVMAAWIPFMIIAVQQSDDRVIDNYYKEGRMYNMRLGQDRLAAELGIEGELFLDLEVGEIVVTLASSDSTYALPQQLQLHLDHPIEEDHDLTIVLQQIYPGRYLGQLEQRIQYRRYVRLLPLLPDPDARAAQADSSGSWRITGELDLSRGNRLKFGGYE